MSKIDWMIEKYNETCMWSYSFRLSMQRNENLKLHTSINNMPVMEGHANDLKKTNQIVRRQNIGRKIQMRELKAR